MKIPRITGVIAGAAAVALMFSGCASSTPGTGGEGSSGTETKSLTIGFVAAHFDTYFTSVQKGLEKAAAANGSKVIAVSYDDDAGKEAQAYQDLISRGVNIVVTSPFDAKGSVTGLRNVSNANIPVICYNTCLNDADAKKYVSKFVQSDNTALGTATGEYAADYIEKNLDGKATVGILNCDIFAVCKLRKAGFVDALKDKGIDVTVAADQTAYLPDKTVAAAQAMLTANPDINVMWSATDGGGSGALSAVKSAGDGDKVKVFSTDVSSALLTAITGSDDILLATTGQDGDSQGAAIFKAAQTAKVGTQISPFQELIPGVLYSVDDKSKAQAWLSENK